MPQLNPNHSPVHTLRLRLSRSARAAHLAFARRRSSSVSITITGWGFPYPALPGALCVFERARDGNPAGIRRFVPATTLSGREVTCGSPAGGERATWAVQVLPNGLTPAPHMYETATFDEYDLSLVRIHSLAPVGGAVGIETSLTLHGAAFAEYGPAQLVVEVQGDARRRLGVAPPTLLPGTLLHSDRIVCTLPSRTSAGSVAVRISLNGGAQGTFGPTTATYAVYAPPTVHSISPVTGEARGGTLVTISGAGFNALGGAGVGAAAAMAAVRCRFGPEVQPLPPTVHSDTRIECLSTWGAAGAAAVGVSLNSGGSFVRSDVAFTYVGVHPPALLEVYFPQTEATVIYIQFDAQPTNRAGMVGLSPCAQVLDGETVAFLRGDSPDEPLCDWEGDSTLIAYLTMFTEVRRSTPPPLPSPFNLPPPSPRRRLTRS